MERKNFLEPASHYTRPIPSKAYKNLYQMKTVAKRGKGGLHETKQNSQSDWLFRLKYRP